MSVPLDHRGLRFIQVFLQSICDGERDENHPNLIRVNANKAYEMALKKYHGWLVQKIFKVSPHGTRRLCSFPLPWEDPPVLWDGAGVLRPSCNHCQPCLWPQVPLVSLWAPQPVASMAVRRVRSADSRTTG